MINDLQTFSTHDADFAGFLMLQGIKFFECTVDQADKNRAVFIFLDEKGVCRDLERSFVSSDISKFCSLRRYLLKEVFRTLRNIGK